ncbi:hypothetical protein Golob_021557, partial [Gossypium lobatum]|nr:hypothetical protein [Gossypium lobatum]
SIGGIPLPIFSEWWLAREKFSAIDSFILSSFPGATFHGCNGLSVKYQIVYVARILCQINYSSTPSLSPRIKIWELRLKNREVFPGVQLPCLPTRSAAM